MKNLSKRLNFNALLKVQSPLVEARGRKEWDERLGAPTIQAMNWRNCTFGLIGLNVLTLIGMMILIGKSQVETFIVEVDKVGAPKVSGRIDSARFGTEHPVYRYFLERFIANTRSIPQDPVVLRQQWLEAYDFMSQAAVQKLKEYGNDPKTDPFARQRSERVEVEVASITPLNNGKTYQVQWREKTYGKDGTLMSQDRYNALISIALKQPESEEAIRKNPLGFYITEFSWNKLI